MKISYQIFGIGMPAYNGRFCKMAAVTPQTILYKFARYYPAASAVEAATSQSRLVVRCKRRTVRWTKYEKSEC
jgi:hypothetical protein